MLSESKEYLRFSSVCTERTWRFKCSDLLNSLPHSSRLQVKTRLETSGLNDARRARALAEAEDSDAQEEEDELEVLEVKEPMEDAEVTEVIEVEDAVACMGTLSMGPEQGD